MSSDRPVILYPPGDIEKADRNYYQTINTIETMEITGEGKKIYEANAQKPMR